MNEPASTVFDRVGRDGIMRLSAAFYRRVAADDLLGTIYPRDDLEGAEMRLASFLIQRFGGPDDYSQQRGHPRLRMRHAPFAIDRDARDRWMHLMAAALRECSFEADVRQQLIIYFEDAATFMINR